MDRILVHFDTDARASVFDRVVAVDAGVHHLFTFDSVTPDDVEPLVHGAMFTRGPDDLKNTAVFVGGSDVEVGTSVYRKVLKTFFGPLSVSTMLDSNGSNTTAAAAVVSAARHVPLKQTTALVLGATGPVGFRVAQLLGAEGADVYVASRSQDRAESAVKRLRENVTDGTFTAVAASAETPLPKVTLQSQLVFAAGAAGVCLLTEEQRTSLTALKVAVDLNAVPPLGIAGVSVHDKAVERDAVFCYGAIGVGGLKMKVHRAAVAQLFESNDRQLDTDAIYQIAKQIG